MPTSTQTLKKEATSAALRYSRGKLRSNARMSFTLYPSLSGQRHPKSPPFRLERPHDTMTLPETPSFLDTPDAHMDQRGATGNTRVPADLAAERESVDVVTGGLP